MPILEIPDHRALNEQFGSPWKRIYERERLEKEHLYKLVAERMGMYGKKDKQLVLEAVDQTFKAVADMLVSGYRWNIRGFGTFYLVDKRPVKTTAYFDFDEWVIPERAIVKFRPSPTLGADIRRNVVTGFSEEERKTWAHLTEQYEIQKKKVEERDIARRAERKRLKQINNEE